MRTFKGKIVRWLALSTALTLVGPLVSPSATGAAPGTISASALTLPVGNNGFYQGFLPAFACATAVSCVTSGTYLASNGSQNAAVFTKSSGSWSSGQAIRLSAGSSTANPETAVCGAVGNCTIAGTYTGGGSSQISFVVTDSNGLLSPVTALPMPTNQLSAGQYSQPHDISCTTDTCVVVGTYQTAATGTEGFISTVRNQVGTTVQLRLPTARNLKPQVAINQVNCWGSGACVAVGSYVDANGVGRAFGVSSANGVWGVAQPITLPVNASAYAAATLLEVTCSTASACTAVGTYLTSTGARVPFGVSFTNGVWAQASTISLPKDAATSPSAYLWGFRGLSCPTTGNCSFGGDYTSTSGLRQGFLVNESGGTWQSATTLPLPTGAKQAGANGGVIAVSCPAPGTCTAAAAFIDAQNQYQAEVVSETNNVWSRPTQLTLPNRATSVGVDGGIYGIACFPTSGCALVGTYLNGRLYQGFSAQA